MTTAIEPVAAAKMTELQGHVDALAVYARDLVVDSAESEQQASDMLNQIKAREKLIRETFDPNIARWYEGHRAATGVRKGFLDKLKPPNTLISSKVLAYRAKQEAIRKAEEDRLRKQAMKEAEDARLAEAECLEAEGRKEEAQQVVDAPVVPPPVVLAPRAPQAKGVATVTTWKHKVLDASLVPRQWLVIDAGALAAYAKKMKDVAQVPGVAFYAETGLQRRG